MPMAGKEADVSGRPKGTKMKPEDQLSFIY